MVFINSATRQITAKIVYYGPGLSGKTTNLEWIYKHTDSRTRGEMVSLETETDRTLFFDLLPIDVGVIGGFKVRFQLYTVPGQVFYNSTRKLVLRGVDGIVFVADSQQEMMEKNVDSLENLRENLRELGLQLETIPLVFQYNKRDLKNISSIEELNSCLNPDGLPYFEAVATEGKGVFETLKAIAKLTLASIRRRALEPQTTPEAGRVEKAPPQPSVIPTSPDAVTPVVTTGGGSLPVMSAGPARGAVPVDVDRIPERVEFARVENEAVDQTPIPMKKVSLRSIEDIEKELSRIRREVTTVTSTPQPSGYASGSRKETDILGRMAKIAEDALAEVLPAKKTREVRKHIKVKMSANEFESASRVGLDLHVLGENFSRHFRKVLETEVLEKGEVKKVKITLEIDLIPKK